MRYTYDDEADAVYVHLREDGEDAPVARSIVVDEGRVVDVDAGGRPIGIEVVSASNGVALSDLAERFGLSHIRPHLQRLEAMRFQSLADA